MHRRRDLAAINKDRLIRESNYCFGEGGAEHLQRWKTLYPAPIREANIASVLNTFIEHGCC